jgi:hypothetical protein
VTDSVTEDLVEPLPEPRPPETTQPAIAPDAALSRKNNLWGLALFGVFVLLFAGTIGIALVYLALD